MIRLILSRVYLTDSSYFSSAHGNQKSTVFCCWSQHFGCVFRCRVVPKTECFGRIANDNNDNNKTPLQTQTYDPAGILSAPLKDLFLSWLYSNQCCICWSFVFVYPSFWSFWIHEARWDTRSALPLPHSFSRATWERIFVNWAPVLWLFHSWGDAPRTGTKRYKNSYQQETTLLRIEEEYRKNLFIQSGPVSSKAGIHRGLV